MTGRFDYVKFDGETADNQQEVKAAFEALEALIVKHLPPGRPQSIVMTHLEDAYTWTGKGLRDRQVARSQKAEPEEDRETA